MIKLLKVLLVLILVGCVCIGNTGLAATPSGNPPLIDNRDVYKQDDSDVNITHLYITVLKKPNKKKHVVTLNEVNEYKETPGSKKPEAEVIFQEGTDEGVSPSGFQGKGKIEIRGNSSSWSTQKSYRIKLGKKSGSWKGFTEINLNKHSGDLTRVRNKLSFEYFRLIPNITSLRTRFLYLHIKDLTANIPTNQFEDYGVYTLVEQVDKSFLKNHRLDPEGLLYKAEMFEFYRYPDELKNVKAPGYDKKKFEKVLGIINAKDHQSLLKMLDDLNNEKIPVNTVAAKYFNSDNFMTWLAINILMGNTGTNAQNFILYSPSKSNAWYFLPWDYDNTWGIHGQAGGNVPLAKWQKGLSNYWGMVLVNRMFHEPKNLNLLKDKIELIAKILNKQRTEEMVNKYYPVISPLIQKNPDLDNLPAPAEMIESEYKRLADIPEQNRQDFYKGLENPMPFYMGEPEPDKNKMLFMWDPSFDLQGDAITYKFQLSRDPDFTDILVNKTLSQTEITIDKPKDKVFYWRVIAEDKKGNSQTSFDTYIDKNEKEYFGVKLYSNK